MGKTALEVLEEEAHWAKDHVFHHTLEQFSDNMDTFPMVGFGLSFVRRSAEGVLINRVEKDIMPRIDEHLEVQMEVVDELASGKTVDEIREEYEERLLETNLLWEAIENEEAQEELVEADIDSCRRAAEWVESGEGEEFGDFADLAHSIGKSPEEAVNDIEPLLSYLPNLLEKYRDDIDLSSESSLLKKERVREWFMEHLIEGLEKGQRSALEDLESRLEEKHAD